MKPYEILAILPAVRGAAPESRLLFVTVAGYTAVLQKRPHQIMQLPPTRKKALEQAAARQGLLEACMPLGPLLVFRPQSYVAEDDIPALIAANRPTLDLLSAQLHGMVQFQVSVSWTPADVLNRFRDAPELTGLFQSGQTTTDDLTGAVTALADRLCANITALLAEVSSDLLHLPTAADMLTNTVVLLPSSQTAQLDQTVEAIDAIWPEGFAIRQIGPSAAASFALLGLTPITPADVAGALAQLNLSNRPVSDAVQHARKAALRSRPHKVNTIRRAANLVDAARRVGSYEQGFMLCTVQSDGQAALPPQQQVA